MSSTTNAVRLLDATPQNFLLLTKLWPPMSMVSNFSLYWKLDGTTRGAVRSVHRRPPAKLVTVYVLDLRLRVRAHASFSDPL